MMVDNAETLRFLKTREAKRQRRLDRLFKQATDDCARIVQFIINEFDPTEVWQWGSLLYRPKYSEYSDIDIAVSGLADPTSIFEILRCAEDETVLPLDIVELERIEREFANLIRLKGVRIYERP